MPMFMFAVQEIFAQRLNLIDEVLIATLMAPEFIPNYETMIYYSDVAEYARGAVEITDRSWGPQGLIGRNPFFEDLTGEEVGSVVTWVNRGTPETSVLVGYGKLREVRSPSGVFGITWSAFGVVNWKNQPVFY